MRGVSCKGAWLARWVRGTTVIAGALFVFTSARAEAPTEQPRPKAQLTKRARDLPAKPQRAPKPAKPSAKTTSKSAKKEKHAGQRSSSATSKKPRASKPPPEQQALDVDNGPDQPCHVQLRNAGVSFVKLRAQQAPAVEQPIRLTGPVAGVEIKGAGRNKATHYLDCRLGLALVRWAPQLKAAGVKGIDHYSIYRPDAAVSGTVKLSGHARALAIDAARFHLVDGRTLTVLENWTDKTKGADPCAPRPQQAADERTLRELVCDASKRGIFSTVVTPHHNPEHDNHVHLEVSEPAAPTWIH